MYFRSQRKYQGDVSLSDSIDSDREGNALSLMDVISVDDDMLENLDTRDSCAKVRQCVQNCLTDREIKVITLRYGLDGEPQKPSGKSPPSAASAAPMYPAAANANDVHMCMKFYIYKIDTNGGKIHLSGRAGVLYTIHRNKKDGSVMKSLWSCWSGLSPAKPSTHRAPHPQGPEISPIKREKETVPC